MYRTYSGFTPVKSDSVKSRLNSSNPKVGFLYVNIYTTANVGLVIKALLVTDIIILHLFMVLSQGKVQVCR